MTRDAEGRPVVYRCEAHNEPAGYAEGDFIDGRPGVRRYCRKCLPDGFLPGTGIVEASAPAEPPAKVAPVESVGLFEWDGETK